MALSNARQKLGFFAIGAATAAAGLWTLGHEPQLADLLAGVPGTPDSLATWKGAAAGAIKYSFWWLGAIVLVANIVWIDRFEFPAYAAGGLATLLVAAALFFYGYRIDDYLSRKGFDATVWQRPPAEEPHARLHMVDDLLRKHQLRGLPSAAVERLLGLADETGYFADWDFVYWLGPERSWVPIDSEWLVLRLGPDGKVADVRIVRD